MDIACIYSFGMFVKVVGYQTDRVQVPVAGMKRNPGGRARGYRLYHVTGTLGDVFKSVWGCGG